MKTIVLVRGIPGAGEVNDRIEVSDDRADRWVAKGFATHSAEGQESRSNLETKEKATRARRRTDAEK